MLKKIFKLILKPIIFYIFLGLPKRKEKEVGIGLEHYVVFIQCLKGIVFGGLITPLIYFLINQTLPSKLVIISSTLIIFPIFAIASSLWWSLKK
jgi:hypothetical protein